MVMKGIITFNTTPSIVATGVTAGPLERKSSKFADLFDRTYPDELCGLKTNEDAHAKLMEDACMIVLNKLKKEPKDVDFLIMGDLVNQMTPSNFCATTLAIPYIGVSAACATSTSSLIMAGALTEMGMSTCTLAGASSHHNSIERQFRYPVEYGSQKPATAQWTVTAAGAAAVVPYKKGTPTITKATIGVPIDMGLKNPFNMGTAMAPAAADTLRRHFKGHGVQASDYDVIITGDLASVGFDLYKTLLEKQKIDTSKNFRDAGDEFFGGDPDFLAGASGAGCSAVVYFSDVYSKMMNGEYQKVLLLATGALLSPLSFQQGGTIPCIAHAVELTMK